MSDQELDPAVIKATQVALGKFIKKPPLTEKLLRKPPFRYLMDVFNAFIKQTGCFEGLYAPEEQLFENIGDRNDKTRFLQKMIDITKLTTKLELKVRTSKIVAGQEPKLTNELLQAMASVAEQQLDWQDALQQVLQANGQQQQPKPANKAKDTKTAGKQISPTGKEDAVQQRQKRISPQEQKLRKATEQTARNSPPTKEKVPRKTKPSPEAEAKAKLSRQGSKQKSPSPVKPTVKVKQQTSTESEAQSMSIAAAAPASTAEQSKSRTEKSTPPAPVNTQPVAEATKEPSPPATTAADSLTNTEPESRKSSSKSRRSSGSQRQPLAEVDAKLNPEESEKLTVSPTVPTADANNNSSSETKKEKEKEREREGTFTRDNSKESTGSVTRPRTSLRPPSARPASARPGAPRRRNVEIVLQPNDQLKMSNINVKLETFGDFDDDGENLVIIEDANAHDIETGAKETPLDADAQQGRLVQQILETQKELVQQGGETNKEEQQKTQQHGARQSSARQMNDLRDIIQTLTKSVNPLGKLMDFIPEDIDAMQLELTMWRDTYTQAAAELKRERSLTASATEPMKQQLLSTEASIEEYKELVDESRHKILQNNERILKMLMEQ